jgi:hypothetical protein
MTTAMLIEWVLVTIIAMIAGTILARRWSRQTDAYWIGEGRCPSCRARKSLLATPMSRVSVVMTCAKCEDQWFCTAPLGQEIVTGIGKRVYMPPLGYRFNGKTATFSTNVGEAHFDIAKLPFNDEIAKATSPREFLRLLARLDVAPKVCHVKGTADDPYQVFLASAGIDLPFEAPEGPMMEDVI